MNLLTYRQYGGESENIMGYFISGLLEYKHQIKAIETCKKDKDKKSKALFLYGQIKFDLGMLYSPHNDDITDYNKVRIHTRFYSMLEDLQEIILNWGEENVK